MTKTPLLGTLFATAVVSAILAAPGDAAKPEYSITCIVGTSGVTTLTWISGASGAHVIWQDGSVNPATVGDALVTITTHGRGSVNLNTPANAATARVTFSGRKPAELAPVTCTPT